MANAVTPDAPRARPSTVNLAVKLMYLLAALQIISVLIGVTSYSAYKEAYAATLQGTEFEGDEGAYAGFAIGTVVAVGVIFAILYLILAIFTGRGSNVARIITWVVSGIALCCLGFGLLTTLGSNSMGGGGNGIDAEELQRNIESSLPGWYMPVSIILSVIGLLTAIAIIVLLALPKSHPFFRKQTAAQTWEPPVPGST